ncbi:MAG: hypothetical protein ACPGXY_01995 [Alphaproteobacteria bacterium]
MKFIYCFTFAVYFVSICDAWGHEFLYAKGLDLDENIITAVKAVKLKDAEGLKVTMTMVPSKDEHVLKQYYLGTAGGEARVQILDTGKAKLDTVLGDPFEGMPDKGKMAVQFTFILEDDGGKKEAHFAEIVINKKIT